MGSFSQKVWSDLPPHPSSRVSLALRNAGVQKSPELLRILDLPRRTLDTTHDLTDLYKTVGGSLTLRPIQSAALLEAEKANGLVGAIGVGHGKTLVLLLVADALRATRAVLLVPPELKRQLLEVDIPHYGKHFKLPLDRVSVVAYSELSSAKKADILERLQPDLIVADEAHRLRRKESARTRRFLRYMKLNPECRFVALSGSLTTGSIRDYAHLADCALKEGSPLPREFRALMDWSDALDPPRTDKGPMAPGALVLLCRDDNEPVREGFRRRLVETPGWVATTDQSFSGSLYLRKRSLDLPKTVSQKLDELRKTWAIGAEELTDPMALARYAKQLACGFYYRWSWPQGIPDKEWVEARRAWHREVRSSLLHRSKPGMDSPLLLANAAAAGRWKSEHWSAWDAVRKRPEPKTEAVWLSDFLVDDAVKWADKAGRGIIWFSHSAVGEAISQSGNFPLFAAGADASETNATRDPVICCSVFAQVEGKNLQSWSNNLLTSPSSNPKTWEQVLGRTHRQGQQADEVWCDFYQHTEENRRSFEKAREGARYIEETFGAQQKILLASVCEGG